MAALGQMGGPLGGSGRGKEQAGFYQQFTPRWTLAIFDRLPLAQRRRRLNAMATHERCSASNRTERGRRGAPRRA